MFRRLLPLTFLLFVTGCAGSSSSSEPTPTAVMELSGTMQDGAEVAVEFIPEPGGEFDGTFYIASSPASQGSFFGTLNGGTYRLECEPLTGEPFTMIGTATSGDSYHFTRSDQPGQTIVLHRTPSTAPQSRGAINFKLNIGPNSAGEGSASINTTPTHSFSNGTKMYSGSWNGYALSLTVSTEPVSFFVLGCQATQPQALFQNTSLESLATEDRDSVDSSVSFQPHQFARLYTAKGGVFHIRH